MKTGISIPDPLFAAADRAAQRLRLSRSELYARALERYLAQESDTDVTARLDVVYVTDPGTIDPALAGAQAKAISRHV